MGAYLEKNLQAFGEMQARFAEQSKGAGFDPQLWSQFMSGQAPMMQGLMGNYLEQSKNLFLQMQEQFQSAGNIFPGMPGFPPQPPKK